MAPERVSSVIRQQLELRAITGEQRCLDVAREWMVLADAILGLQPSWHSHDIGLRHSYSAWAEDNGLVGDIAATLRRPFYMGGMIFRPRL